MSDRFVCQIDPRPKAEVVTPKRISDYAGTANVVLLGDPGAGKSHLFEELAQAVMTNVLSARAFLNMPPGPAGAVLFIDGLDERRAGRSDQATIDLIVLRACGLRAVSMTGWAERTSQHFIRTSPNPADTSCWLLSH